MRTSKHRVPQNLSRNLALASVFGALYAALVVALAPISFLPFQIRFADALLPLAVLFGWPAALGVAVGAAVGNLAGDFLGGFFPYPSIAVDVVAGSFANLLAGLLAWRVGNWSGIGGGKRKGWFLATLIETAVVTLIVGSYLALILPFPPTLPIPGVEVSPLEASLVGVLLGSIVAINVLGFFVLGRLARPRSLQRFRSWGLRVYGGDVPEADS